MDRYESGLQHQSPANPIQYTLGEIAPGASQPVNLRFAVTKPGPWCHVVEVSSPDGQKASAKGCVTGVAPSTSPIKVNVTGPAQVKVGDAAIFVTTITNTGATTIPRLRVVTTPDAPLISDANEAESGRDTSEDAKGHLVWNLTNLEPGVPKTLRFKSVPKLPASRATVETDVYDETGGVQSDKTSIEILPAGTPATNPS